MYQLGLDNIEQIEYHDFFDQIPIYIDVKVNFMPYVQEI